jgi:hypothetical protein
MVMFEQRETYHNSMQPYVKYETWTFITSDSIHTYLTNSMEQSPS